MQKVFYLKTCGTCTKILKMFNLSDWELRELKSAPITEEELAQMYQLTKSYEALFSRRSTQIKARNIELKSLEKNDFKELILDHYSFLKRPVFLTDKEIFVGNDKNNIENLEQFFSGK
ncbi:arsenate reductase family protein [Kaistella flava (ex Peng et al. 2021)]|uniref:Arsenate reductase family protein n=1 Tax=Kaistella flava (ex Peng et al. 2021) TaxID=2038776 RepID=A0A7M2YC73_9FLAO|nr:ArsC/Spx/MgsR family protein [Kaistella flava (ex Peng et al. 2021)]QOW11868.1 arsenate reductase family protein [Kaistella flava (ex Peng et al. 2021)]